MIMMWPETLLYSPLGQLIWASLFAEKCKAQRVKKFAPPSLSEKGRDLRTTHLRPPLPSTPDSTFGSVTALYVLFLGLLIYYQIVHDLPSTSPIGNVLRANSNNTSCTKRIPLFSTCSLFRDQRTVHTNTPQFPIARIHINTVQNSTNNIYLLSTGNDSPIISSIDPSSTNSFFFSGRLSDSSMIAFNASMVSRTFRFEVGIVKSQVKLLS